MEETIDSLLSKNEDAKAAYDAILKRGSTPSFARYEIAGAIFGCLFEASKGMPDRMVDVWAGLKNGRLVFELFPDALYDDGKEQDYSEGKAQH